MKKYLSFVMGLSALMVFSPQFASAAPDTGPKVDNIEVKNISASADQIMPEQGEFLVVSITNDYFSTFVQASGQETVVHRSDHTGNSLYMIDCNANLDKDELVNVNNGNGRLAVVDEPDRSCNCMMNGVNLYSSTQDLGISAAMSAPAFGTISHSMASVTSSYRSVGYGLRG